MHIKIIQKGGFAGLSSELASIDTEKLTPKQKRVVEDVLHSPLWNSAKPSAGADLLEYEIWTVDGGKEHSLSFQHSTETQPLFDLVQKLLTLRSQ
jgi:hypothetical protein